jgi:WD40-like Beta Propeller Repeat
MYAAAAPGDNVAAEGSPSYPSRSVHLPIPISISDMRLYPLVLAALLLAAPAAAAQTVTVDHGNVVLSRRGAAPVRLTSSGRDRDPALSPDGRRVAFVRGGVTRGDATALWIVDVQGGAARRLLAERPSDEPRTNLTQFHAPAFSPDGRTIYFLTNAWVTSSAVHAVEVATGRVRYVCPGNSLEVVPRGEYTGHLVVNQHRYFLGGGSYDWYWLVTPAGRDVGPIGESTEMFEETYVKPK